MGFWESIHCGFKKKKNNKKKPLCVCVCIRGCVNQPQYHHLANIRAEGIKIPKVTEQFHQDNYATINWTDKGSDNSESYNNTLLQSIRLWRFVRLCKKRKRNCNYSFFWKKKKKSGFCADHTFFPPKRYAFISVFLRGYVSLCSSHGISHRLFKITFFLKDHPCYNVEQRCNHSCICSVSEGHKDTHVWARTKDDHIPTKKKLLMSCYYLWIFTKLIFCLMSSRGRTRCCHHRCAERGDAYRHFHMSGCCVERNGARASACTPKLRVSRSNTHLFVRYRGIWGPPPSPPKPLNTN